MPKLDVGAAIVLETDVVVAHWDGVFAVTACAESDGAFGVTACAASDGAFGGFATPDTVEGLYPPRFSRGVVSGLSVIPNSIELDGSDLIPWNPETGGTLHSSDEPRVFVEFPALAQK